MSDDVVNVTLWCVEESYWYWDIPHQTFSGSHEECMDYIQSRLEQQGRPVTGSPDAAPDTWTSFDWTATLKSRAVRLRINRTPERKK